MERELKQSIDFKKKFSYYLSLKTKKNEQQIMSSISTINNFQTIEKSIQTAETSISWLGTRYVILKCDRPDTNQIETIKISFSTFLEQIKQLSNKTLDVVEIESGKKVLKHINENILKKFEINSKAHCLIRLIIAIRDFFCCFFKKLHQTLIDLNTKFSQSIEKPCSSTTLTLPTPSASNEHGGIPKPTINRADPEAVNPDVHKTTIEEVTVTNKPESASFTEKPVSTDVIFKPLLVQNPKFKPLFAIFLDIDGVVYNCPDQDRVTRKVKELFPDRRDNYACSIAAAHLFDKKAIENLDTLISKIEEVAKVQIVISSNWREGRTVEELKTTFFHIHSFSKYIIGKTIEKLNEKEVKNYCREPCHLNEHTFLCRAAEIQQWLMSHPEVLNYVVFDDDDNHLSRSFGNRFIQTKYNKLITSEHVLEALKLIVAPVFRAEQPTATAPSIDLVIEKTRSLELVVTSPSPPTIIATDKTPQDDPEASKVPSAKIDGFQRVGKDLWDNCLFPLLTRSDYGALIRVNHHLNQLITNTQNLSFDRLHERVVYNIINSQFTLTHISFLELGYLDTSFLIKATSSGIVLNNQFLIIKDNYILVILKGNLFKLGIDFHIDKRINVIPKEKFSPPQEKEVELRGNKAIQLNDDYFYIIDDNQVSVWSFDPLECIYAFTAPHPTEDNMKKSIGIYVVDQAIYTWTLNGQIAIVTKKDLNNINNPSTSVEITLPKGILLDDLVPTELGLFYAPKGSAVLYDWDTGVERVRYESPEHREREYMCRMHGFTLRDQFFAYFPESIPLGLYSRSTFYLPEIVKMDPLTGIASTIKFFPHLAMDGLKAATNHENIIVNSYGNNIFVFNTATMETTPLTFNFPFKGIKKYSVTEKGDIVVLTEQGITIFKALTYEIVLNLNGVYSSFFFKEDYLVLQYIPPKRADQHFEFIDLTTYKSLGRLALTDPSYIVLSIHKGRFVLVGMDYNTPNKICIVNAVS